MSSAITLTQLRYLIALDTYRHFRKAAAHCEVAQPSLSTQLRKLEEALGVVLFDREQKPIEPTPIGERVITQARLVLAEAVGLQELVESATGTLVGTLRVGMLPTLAAYLLPLFATTFPARYPHITLVVEEVRREPMLAQVRRGVLDVGLMASPVSARGLVEQVLFEEPLVCYGAAGHALQDQEEVSLRDLTLAEVWLLSKGSSLREQVVGLFQAPTLLPHAVPSTRRLQFEGQGLDAMVRLVEEAGGVTVVPWLFQQRRAAGGEGWMRPFETPAPKRVVRLVHSKALVRKQLAQALAHVISARVTSLLPS